MGRLIDVDELKREIDIAISTGCITPTEYIIDKVPTAYDIDKVVEQLEQLSIGLVLCDECEYREECDDIQEKYEPDDDTDLCAMVAKLQAIEIVKSGGAV